MKRDIKCCFSGYKFTNYSYYKVLLTLQCMFVMVEFCNSNLKQMSTTS